MPTTEEWRTTRFPVMSSEREQKTRRNANVFPKKEVGVVEQSFFHVNKCDARRKRGADTSADTEDVREEL